MLSLIPALNSPSSTVESMSKCTIKRTPIRTNHHSHSTHNNRSSFATHDKKIKAKDKKNLSNGQNNDFKSSIVTSRTKKNSISTKSKDDSNRRGISASNSISIGWR